MKKQNSENVMDKVVSLAKRRGFIFPGSEIYGGLAHSWDYGPLGVELKNNIKQLWWDRFVHRRDDIVGIDATIIMNPKVWEASGHLKNFSDALVECKKCHERFRADEIGFTEAKSETDKMNIPCPNCGKKDWSSPKQFNLMFKTFIGSAEEKSNIAYFRPETAQSMFTNFKNVLDTARKKLPFGIAQIGKAFRNEITPGNYIFRTREFEQMEIEYFVEEKGWETAFEMWRKEMLLWIQDMGADMKKVHEREVPDGERAHYSKRTIDFDYDFPFGTKELYGLAYRTDFDLKNHERSSGVNLKYKDESGNEFLPHVIEPTWGVDRTVLVALLSTYYEDGERTVLKLPLRLAPYKAAVFPLLANKEQLVSKAREVYRELKKHFSCAWDDRGNIGKRYFSQDEIGTPFCITVDFDTLDDNTVTVRDRDTAKQERVKVPTLVDYFKDKLK